MKRLLIHGLEGSSQGHKAQLLRQVDPQLLTPDFTGDVKERMTQLEAILSPEPEPWFLIGSSLGGLMAALWTCRNPRRVRRLILLAPALHRPEFERSQNYVPTMLVHGTKDTVVPLEPVAEIARSTFLMLDFHAVEDDHRLKATMELLDWHRLLELEG